MWRYSATPDQAFYEIFGLSLPGHITRVCRPAGTATRQYRFGKNPAADPAFQPPRRPNISTNRPNSTCSARSEASGHPSTTSLP